MKLKGILLVTFLLHLLFSSKSYGEKFLDYVEKKDFCKVKFLKTFNGTIFSTLSKELYVTVCENVTVVNPKDLKNSYAKLELAQKLIKKGKKGEAKEVLKEVLSSTNNLDLEVLTLNNGTLENLLIPKVAEKKFWLALRNREFEEAEVYLSFLPKNSKYDYLKGVLLFKERRYRESKEFFQKTSYPYRFFFLTFLAKEPAEKFYYFSKLMDSNVKEVYKKAAAVYLLDKFLYKDLGFYRKVLRKVRKPFPKLYRFGKLRGYLFSFELKKALTFLNSPKTEEERVWKEVIKGKLGLTPDYSFLTGKTSFYSLLLSCPPEVEGGKVEVKDKELEELISKGYCFLIPALDSKSKELPKALFKCGYYYKALKLSLKLGVKKPLKLLYPKPPLFGNDLVSLAIARQESLFNHLALSRSGAIGLMQIMPFTGKYLAKKLSYDGFSKEKLFNPYLNYKFGSYYIHELIKSFGNFPLAAAAYNGGPGNLRKALKRFGKIETKEDLVLFTDFFLPFAETRNYVKRVSENLFFYSTIYGSGKEWKSLLKP